MSNLVAITKALEPNLVPKECCSPIERFFIHEAKKLINPSKNTMSFEFYNCALFLLSSPFKVPELRLAHTSVICFAHAAKNPTLHALAPLYFTASSLTDFANSVLSFLRLLHISDLSSGSLFPRRLCVSHMCLETLKKALISYPNIRIVGISDGPRIYLGGPNAALALFRKSLPRPSSARFISDPVGYGSLTGTSNLAYIAKVHNINIFSSNFCEMIHILHPLQCIPVKIRNAQNLLLNLISFALVPFDENRYIEALNTLDVDLVAPLYDTTYSKKTSILQHVPRFIPPPSYSSVSKKCPIAIIGISCRTPGADNVDQFWQTLCDGIDVHQTIPTQLYNVKDYQSTSYKDKNTMRASHSNVLERPGLFDPFLFGEPCETSSSIDPQQRLALMTAYEALETASVISPPESERENAGVFVGACLEEYRENLSNPIQDGLYSDTFRSHLSTRLSSFFDFRGPSITYDTACSSGLVTVESACSYLVSRKCSIALAGGVNILTNPQLTIGLDRGFFLSSTGQCKTFDKGADGYCRSDAVGFVVLKRLDDAMQNRDNILGVIAAASTNHSGTSYSITHPHGPTQAQLYRSGLTSASLSPSDISYVECHGTGTQAGDAEEMQGLLDVFANGGDHGDENRKNDLIIGSVKANIGHSGSCAGITALLKTILVLQHKNVPPHPGIRSEINPKFPVNLAELGIKIPGLKEGVKLT